MRGYKKEREASADVTLRSLVDRTIFSSDVDSLSQPGKHMQIARL